jgi:hypothetical protein
MLGILSIACRRQTFTNSNKILRRACELHIMEIKVPRKGILLHSRTLRLYLP